MLLGIHREQAADNGDSSETQTSEIDGLKCLGVGSRQDLRDGFLDSGAQAWEGLQLVALDCLCERRNLAGGESCSSSWLGDCRGDGGGEAVGQDRGVNSNGDRTSRGTDGCQQTRGQTDVCGLAEKGRQSE